MKKLLLLLCTVGIVSFSNAQAIEDNAVIPLSVSLNSIMRLSVTSGGNIEFAFNSIDQYDTGIPTGPRYQTAFTVSSSVNFDVDLTTEDLTLVGNDDPSNTLTLGVVGIEIRHVGTGPGTESTLTPSGAAAALTDAQTIVANNTGNSGDGAQNSFIIDWNAGVLTTIKSLNPPADRYATTCYLTLSAN